MIVFKFYTTGIFASATLAVIFNKTDPVFWTFLFLMFLFIFLSVNQSKKDIDRERDLAMSNFKNLMKLNYFSPTEYLLTDSCKNGIAIDEDNSKLAVYEVENNFIHLINFSEVLEVHLIKDGDTITKTSRGSQLGGAVIGGVLAGGFGAVIGGLSGKQITNEEINKINIEIVVNNLKKPVHTVSFVNRIDSLNKNDKKYQELIDITNHWFRLLSVVIKRNENERA